MNPPTYGMKPAKNVRTPIGNASGRPSRVIIRNWSVPATREIRPVPRVLPLTIRAAFARIRR